MKNNVEKFFANLKGKKVGIIGLGVSHNDLIKLMLSKGINITLLDRREKEQIEEYVELAEQGVLFDIGDTYLDNLTAYDVIFRTPGMYFLNKALTKARKKGIVITSELEVFFELCPAKIYGVTGSDGKTTTSTLIAEMLRRTGVKVFLGGNIGTALLSQIEQITDKDVCVVELSSFQLISMRCSPDVAVITNITPNHLDVHKDMAEYIDCKKNLIAHQGAFTKTVLSADNEECYNLSPLVRGSLNYFSIQRPVKNGTYLNQNDELVRVKNGVETIMFNRSEIRIMGTHNVENYLTAIAAVCDVVTDEDILEVARDFGGVEHRIEFVREVRGVSYYNDSIASSPTRTIAGLLAFPKKPIIIAGGYDKNISYEPLGPILAVRAKLVILLGATADKIQKALVESEQYKQSPIKIIRVDTLEDAVKVAQEKAVRGDIVSLSPASASFDLYKNFEQRGKHYKKIVNELV